MINLLYALTTLSKDFEMNIMDLSNAQRLFSKEKNSHERTTVDFFFMRSIIPGRVLEMKIIFNVSERCVDI